MSSSLVTSSSLKHISADDNTLNTCKKVESSHFPAALAVHLAVRAAACLHFHGQQALARELFINALRINSWD